MRMRRLIALFVTAIALCATTLAQTLPQGVQKVTSIEGVTEYAFPNGLHVLLFPDNSKPKITVNVVYLVGSRNEGYGETGMAHLLEHMTFKSAKSGRELFKELTDRAGGNFNGKHPTDQTMYFETFNASDENLRWALGLEADRMVNMTMLKKDLDSEMTVVRNEMESGENSPLNVLNERVHGGGLQLPQLWKVGHRQSHRRGKSAHRQPGGFLPEVLPARRRRSDHCGTVRRIEGAGNGGGNHRRHPQAAARAHAAVHGGADAGRRALRHFAPRGKYPGDHGVYHIPAALHPDMAPLEVMAQVLGAPQTGRLYKALVDTKKAVV
jgi:zinc protease